MRVAITNNGLWPPSGTVVYVRDLALELQRRGHEPVVVSSSGGVYADQLRAAGITVWNSYRRPGGSVDVIHGHHYAPTLLALAWWPDVPAIHLCHDSKSPEDATPLHPNILAHFGVSPARVSRLMAEGVPAARVQQLANFVDTRRFQQRPTPLPPRPHRALLFSNNAAADGSISAIRLACQSAGIELDLLGQRLGRSDARPERILANYDVVFAMGKSALEAMAVGAAVILCDSMGAGPMVTADEFDLLHHLNFGVETLSRPLSGAAVTAELARYNVADARRVSAIVRERASAEAAVMQLLGIYSDVLTRYSAGERQQLGRCSRLSGAEAMSLALFWKWRSIPPSHRERLKNIPGLSIALRLLRSVLRRSRKRYA